jgi:hypothetical protein
MSSSVAVGLFACWCVRGIHDNALQACKLHVGQVYRKRDWWGSRDAMITRPAIRVRWQAEADQVGEFPTHVWKHFVEMKVRANWLKLVSADTLSIYE